MRDKWGLKNGETIAILADEDNPPQKKTNASYGGILEWWACTYFLLLTYLRRSHRAAGATRGARGTSLGGPDKNGKSSSALLAVQVVHNNNRQPWLLLAFCQKKVCPSFVKKSACPPLLRYYSYILIDVVLWILSLFRRKQLIEFSILMNFVCRVFANR